MQVNQGAPVLLGFLYHNQAMGSGMSIELYADGGAVTVRDRTTGTVRLR